MLSFTGRQQEFQDITNVVSTDTANINLSNRLMNQSEKRILTMKDWPFLEALDTSLTTVAGQQFYTLPQNVSKRKSVYVVVSSLRYTPREITSREEWDRTNLLSYTSDFPAYFYAFGNQIGIWPTPATSGNTIGLVYRKTPKDLSIADYTTGGIITATNGTTPIVCGTTAFVTSFIGRYLQITESNTTNKGDEFWYQISSVPSTTNLELTSPYVGTSIIAGSAAFVIGQMSLLPEGYTDLPVFDAVRQFYTSIQPNSIKATLYDGMFKSLMEQMVQDQSDKTSSPVLDYGQGQNELINPNLTISL